MRLFRYPESYLLAVLLALFGALVVVGLWNEYAHPCVRSVPDTCSSTYCVVYTDVGGSQMCSVYATDTYECTRCVERGTR